MALTQHGLVKLLNSDDLSVKPMDPEKLDAHVRTKMDKEERLALVRVGREDRDKNQVHVAVNQKKLGYLSNQQKEHKKILPFATKKLEVAKS